MESSDSLTDEAFVKAFPFGFVVGATGTVRVLGRALERRFPGQVGKPADETFELVRPNGPETLAKAVALEASLVLLRCRQDGMLLRGQLLAGREPGAYLFVGTASIRSLDDMRRFSVQLSDFAPQDATPDLLMLLQANEASLQDARSLAKELEGAVEKARVASESKGRFLAVMSHEIRTTLNGMGAMVDVLGATSLDGEQRDAVEVMSTSTEQLAAILNDVLDLSRIESGAVSVERLPFEIGSTCDGVLRLFRASATQRGLELTLDLDPALPAHVLGDPTRVRQILSNLVGNAVKFTFQGEIGIRVVAGEGDTVEFEVHDTGPGIARGQRALLFEPFHQSNAGIARRFGGTGLGLTICRELVRLMGGEIELKDSSSAGSTFRFTITAPATVPADTARRGRQSVDGLRSLKDLRVLVAEDHPTNQRVLERLLGQLEVEATFVRNGREAVEQVQDEAFDLVLMDIEMPVLDGVGAAREIRAADVEWSDVPIIACSAGVFQEDRKAAREAGMGGFLTKPIRLAHLREALARVAAGLA